MGARIAVKREHVAWVLLMASFVYVAGYYVSHRHTLMARLHDSSRAVLMVKARQFLKEGNEAGAADLYRRLARNYPKREDVLLEFADFLVTQKAYVEAEEYYRRAVFSGVNRSTSLRRYAALLDRLNRPGDILAMYRQYLERQRNDTVAHLDLGIRLLNARLAGESIVHFTAASQNLALRYEAESRLALAYRATGQMREAVAVWLELAQENPAPERQVFWQDIAAAYEKLGENERALTAWEQYLARFPNSLYAAERYASLASAVGDIARQLRATLRMDALKPEKRLDKPLSTRIVLVGVTGAQEKVSAGSFIAVDALFQFKETISRNDSNVVQFWLIRNGEPRLLTSEPAQLGPVPLWRGDCVRQQFRAAVPVDVAPGEYRLEVSIEAPSAPRIALWPLKVTRREKAK